MYRFFGEEDAYSLFNNISVYVTIVLCFLFIKEKTKSLGLYSRCAIFFASKMNRFLGKCLKYILAFVEIALLTTISLISVRFNYPFGELVGTGANYFGALFVLPILGSIISIILMANPLSQMDIMTILLPIRLLFLKIACFLNGCCWGIEWKYGLYNYHYDHPGRQVPVQAIEAIFALAIFIFLLIYRKKAKPGTMYPMYMILYSATRFCSEFFRHEENVLGPLKTYHLLCIAGFVIGLVLYFIAVKFGDRMFNFIDKRHKKIDMQIETYKVEHQEEWNRQAEEKARKKESLKNEKRKVKN